MWIVLTILGILATIITAILLHPVQVIIKNDEKENFILRYKFLYKTFGENPNPDDPLVKTLKKAGGVDRLEKVALQENIREEGLQKAVSDSYDALIALLKELLFLFKNCTVTKFDIKIRCAADEPDETAVQYGLCSAATHTLFSVLSSFLKVRQRGCNIDIDCDFYENNPIFRYCIVLSIPFRRVLAAFWRVVLTEAKRAGGQAK